MGKGLSGPQTHCGGVAAGRPCVAEVSHEGRLDKFFPGDYHLHEGESHNASRVTRVETLPPLDRVPMTSSILLNDGK